MGCGGGGRDREKRECIAPCLLCCVSVYGSELQCVVVGCSGLQCDAVYTHTHTHTRAHTHTNILQAEKIWLAKVCLFAASYTHIHTYAHEHTHTHTHAHTCTPQAEKEWLAKACL